MGEKTGNDGDQFDSRNLPTKYLPENTNDYEKTSGPINWIIKAIDDGFDLTTIINKNRRELDEFLDIETSAEEEAYF